SQYVAQSYIEITTGLLETSPRLGVVFDEIATAYAVSHRLRESYGPIAHLPVRQFVRCMAGLTRRPGSFDDDEVDEASLIASYGANFRLVVRFGTYRALAGAIFGDWAAALHYSALAVRAMGAFPISYHDTLLQWVRALALRQALRRAALQEQATLLAELEPLDALFAAHAREMPKNFGHLHGLLRALRAEAEGDWRAAAVAFEDAADDALEHERPYHHALARELMAEFYASHGLRSSARANFQLALQAYQEWGADGKVAQMRGSVLFTGVITGAPRGGARDVNEAFDVIGLAEAGQVMAQERDPERLPALLFDLVRRYAAAERGRLFWFDDGDWIERAGFGPHSQWMNMVGPASPRPQAEAPVPSTVLNYLTQAQQPLLLRNVSLHARFGQDSEVRRLGIKSIVGLPINRRGETVGLLYLDNVQAHTELESRHLETLRLIGLQFAIAFEYAQIRHQLEREVGNRTADLARSRSALQAILDGSPAMISMKDREGRLLLHNRRWTEVFSRSGESLIGRRLVDVEDGNPMLLARALVADREVIETGESQRSEFEIPLDNELRTFQELKFPVRDPDGKTFAVGMVS
ncbi:MAG: PAS domain-containing protein, partial [Rhizobacter sp.]